jgi:hypothetical protein
VRLFLGRVLGEADLTTVGAEMAGHTGQGINGQRGDPRMAEAGQGDCSWLRAPFASGLGSQRWIADPPRAWRRKSRAFTHELFLFQAFGYLPYARSNSSPNNCILFALRNRRVTVHLGAKKPGFFLQEERRWHLKSTCGQHHLACRVPKTGFLNYLLNACTGGA